MDLHLSNMFPIQLEEMALEKVTFSMVCYPHTTHAAFTIFLDVLILGL